MSRFKSHRGKKNPKNKKVSILADGHEHSNDVHIIPKYLSAKHNDASGVSSGNVAVHQTIHITL